SLAFRVAALALEAPDLRAQGGHGRLGALDALRESMDLGLLHRQAALALLELGEQRRLARARGGGLRTLLLEPLLRLLELLLLARHRILPLGRLARRGGCEGEKPGQREERQGAHASAHGSRRPRASQPPSAPSSVPAASSIIRLASGKNWRCERPSVRLTSGSRRGATSSCATTSAPSARSA